MELLLFGSCGGTSHDERGQWASICLACLRNASFSSATPQLGLTLKLGRKLANRNKMDPSIRLAAARS